MANISESWGELSLQGRWKKRHIITLLYLLYALDTGSDYTTVLSDKFEDALSNAKLEPLKFYGTGRWAYGGNLESLTHWVVINKDRWEHTLSMIPEKYHITHKQYLKKIQWLFKQMFKRDLYISWDYLDIECGISFLSRSMGVHRPCRVVKPFKYFLDYSEDTIESWDCNLKNQVEVFFEGDQELLDGAVFEILELYKHPELTEELTKIIKEHDTWYNISAWPYFETKSDVPKGIRTALNKLIKEKTNDNK